MQIHCCTIALDEVHLDSNDFFVFDPMEGFKKIQLLYKQSKQNLDEYLKFLQLNQNELMCQQDQKYDVDQLITISHFQITTLIVNKILSQLIENKQIEFRKTTFISHFLISLNQLIITITLFQLKIESEYISSRDQKLKLIFKDLLMENHSEQLFYFLYPICYATITIKSFDQQILSKKKFKEKTDQPNSKNLSKGCILNGCLFFNLIQLIIKFIVIQK